MKSILLFIRLIRPIYLFGGILLYALGAGISHYLGENLDWSTYWIGQGWVTAMQLATYFLNEYYDAPDDRKNQNRTLFTGGSGAVGDDKIPRKLVLFLAFASLAVVAALSVAMIGQLKPDPVVILIMVLGFLGGFFYSTPPVRAGIIRLWRVDCCFFDRISDSHIRFYHTSGQHSPFTIDGNFSIGGIMSRYAHCSTNAGLRF